MGDNSKTIKVVILFLLAVLLSKNTSAFSDDQESVKILYIGSSYIAFNNLPLIFQSLALNSGKEIYYDRDRVISGKYLDYHAASSDTEAKIAEMRWDYVVLQGAGPNLAYPYEFPDHPVLPSLVTLEQKIHFNSPSAKIIYFMPRAFEDGMTWYNQWSDTFFDMQQILYDKTIEMAAQVDFAIAPMGWAFRSVLLENNQLHYLYGNDYNHPSYRGSYLMACVLYSTIFLESTLGLTEYGTLSQEEAQYFQTVASSTVLDDLDLWKLSPSSVGEELCKQPNDFKLYQNYPNPFNGYTRIGFELENAANISLTIYDSLGRKISVLLNENLSAGEHFVNFNADNLSSGIYFYEINNGVTFLTKQMLLLK